MTHSEIQWIYGYKSWCKANNVTYDESEDWVFAFHEERMKNPLFAAMYLIEKMNFDSLWNRLF